MRAAEILVIDDNKSDFNLIGDILEPEFSLNLVHAFNASQALPVLKEKSFDLALIDINIPGENGLEFLPKLKAMYPKMKLVVFSGSLLQDHVNQAKEGGADAFIVKPLTATRLLNLIHTIPLFALTLGVK